MNSKRIRLNPGDILAVPRRKNGYHYILFIKSNRFGSAFGIFEARGLSLELPPDWRPSPTDVVKYSGNEFVLNGRWRRIGNREDLLELFSTDPPIYHWKSAHPANDQIGRFGSAETASGLLRDLSEEEADRIGLNSPWFKQILMEEELEAQLERFDDS